MDIGGQTGVTQEAVFSVFRWDKGDVDGSPVSGGDGEQLGDRNDRIW